LTSHELLSAIKLAKDGSNSFFLLFFSFLLSQVFSSQSLHPLSFSRSLSPPTPTKSSNASIIMSSPAASTAPVSTYVPPVISTDGRLGHLTPEQTIKLQQFWVKLYDIFDGKVQFDQTAPSSFKGQAREEENADGTPVVPVQKSGWFSRGKSASESGSVTPRFTGTQLQKTFWKVAMMDHPDLLVLKVKHQEGLDEKRKKMKG